MSLKDTVASIVSKLPGYPAAKLAYREFHDVRPAMRAFEKQGFSPDGAQSRVLAALNADGIATIGITEMIGERDWAALRADMDGFCASRAVVEGSEAARQHRDRGVQKNFLVNRYGHANPAVLAPDNPWLALAVNPRVLDVVNAYLGMWSRFQSLDCWYTIPDPSAPRRNSQNWHRDPEDRHMLKLFLYFRDVAEANGPFEYVPGSSQFKGTKYGHLWPTSPTNRRYPPSEELEQKIPPSERRICTGPAGTLVFCDTTGFHRGGYATGGPRILGTLMYTSPLFRGREYRLSGGIPAGITPAGRFALS